MSMLKYAGQAWLVLVVAVASGAVLAALERQLAPRIAANEKVARAGAAMKLIAGAARAEPLAVEWSADAGAQSAEMYRVLGGGGELLGWAVPAQGKGYSTEPIKLLIGLTRDAGAIVDYAVLSSNETPGLGSKIDRSSFRKAFAGKPAGAHFQAVKKAAGLAGDEVQAITGATISSQAVCDILYHQLAQTGLAAELARRSAAEQ